MKRIILLFTLVLAIIGCEKPIEDNEPTNYATESGTNNFYNQDKTEKISISTEATNNKFNVVKTNLITNVTSNYQFDKPADIQIDLGYGKKVTAQCKFKSFLFAGNVYAISYTLNADPEYVPGGFYLQTYSKDFKPLKSRYVAPNKNYYDHLTWYDNSIIETSTGTSGITGKVNTITLLNSNLDVVETLYDADTGINLDYYITLDYYKYVAYSESKKSIYCNNFKDIQNSPVWSLNISDIIKDPNSNNPPQNKFKGIKLVNNFVHVTFDVTFYSGSKQTATFKINPSNGVYELSQQ